MTMDNGSIPPGTGTVLRSTVRYQVLYPFAKYTVQVPVLLVQYRYCIGTALYCTPGTEQVGTVQVYGCWGTVDRRMAGSSVELAIQTVEKRMHM